MTNYDFFVIEPVTLIGTVINTALLGGIIFLAVDFLRKKYGNKNKK